MPNCKFLLLTLILLGISSWPAYFDRDTAPIFRPHPKSQSFLSYVGSKRLVCIIGIVTLTFCLTRLEIVEASSNIATFCKISKWSISLLINCPMHFLRAVTWSALAPMLNDLHKKQAPYFRTAQSSELLVDLLKLTFYEVNFFFENGASLAMLH